MLGANAAFRKSRMPMWRSCVSDAAGARLLSARERRDEIGRRRAFGPARHAIGNDDALHLPLGPDMGDDFQFVAAVERASAQRHETGPRRVGVEDAREADGTAALARDASARGRCELEDRRRARHLELVFRQDRLQAERAARPGLAVKAMAGIDVREFVGAEAITNGATTATAFE